MKKDKKPIKDSTVKEKPKNVIKAISLKGCNHSRNFGMVQCGCAG